MRSLNTAVFCSKTFSMHFFVKNQNIFFESCKKDFYGILKLSITIEKHKASKV